MKTNRPLRPIPRRRPRILRAANHRTATAVRQRRLHADFLALAFYPGMSPRDRNSAA